MTTVYFVRHAEPNYSNHNDSERELTDKGLKDRELVTKFLSDKDIDIVISSPYKRAVETVKHFADISNNKIEIIEDFSERKVDSAWIEDFNAFCQMQWEDFSYKFSDGESLAEVQNRNVKALLSVVKEHDSKNIVIGSHGTALSTIINFFNQEFQYINFCKIKAIFPWIVKFTFNNENVTNIEYIDVFAL